MLRNAIVAQTPRPPQGCGLYTGQKAAESQPAGTRRYKTMGNLGVILILIVAPGLAAIISFLWLTGVISSLLALLAR